MKNNIDFNIEEIFAQADTNGYVIFNPLTGVVADEEFAVEINSKPISRKELHVVDYILTNLETLNKTNWNLVIFCTDQNHYEVGMMYVTDSIECAVDTAYNVGEGRVYSKYGEYIKPYNIADCLTTVQEKLVRMAWVENYKSFKRI